MKTEDTLKQYRCKRCGDIFSTYRRYQTRGSKRICDDCMKPNSSRRK